MSGWEVLTSEQAEAVAEAMMQAAAVELEKRGVQFTEPAIRDLIRVGTWASMVFAIVHDVDVQSALVAVHDGIVRGAGDRADVRLVRMEGKS